MKKPKPKRVSKHRSLARWMECRRFNAKHGICVFIQADRQGMIMWGEPMEIAG